MFILHDPGVLYSLYISINNMGSTDTMHNIITILTDSLHCSASVSSYFSKFILMKVR